jgi:hypothetical protein
LDGLDDALIDVRKSVSSCGQDIASKSKSSQKC